MNNLMPIPDESRRDAGQTDTQVRAASQVKVDMSGAAISARLDLVNELFRLGRYLQQASPVHPAGPQSSPEPDDSRF